MSNETQTTETETEPFDPTELYRTNAAATFVGHLFKGPDVAAAGVENGDKADHPVPTLCSRRTDRGPFEAISTDEVLEHHAEHERTEDKKRDLCERCVAMAERRIRDAGADAESAPFDPTEFTVDEIDRKLGTDDAYTEDELAALHAAEAAGKDRTTALAAIDKRRGDDS